MSHHEGGCLCGAVRYVATGEPMRITLCYCTFCQRATGSTHLVEPIFPVDRFSVTAGEPARYTTISLGSGKRVDIRFCATCSAKLFLEMERFPGIVGLYGGTFDQPGWFGLDSDKTFAIFLESAPPGAIIPAGIRTYRQHRLTADGETSPHEVYDTPYVVGG